MSNLRSWTQSGSRGVWRRVAEGFHQELGNYEILKLIKTFEFHNLITFITITCTSQLNEDLFLSCVVYLISSPKFTGLVIWYTIYLLTAIVLSAGGSSTVHIYTQTIHRTIQNKQYIQQHNNFGRVWAVPGLGELYPGICLTTDDKAREKPQSG